MTERDDIVARLRRSVTKGHEPTDEDAIAAAAEIERLRAALKEIADDPGGYPAEEAFDEVREVARRALEQHGRDAEKSARDEGK